MKFFKKLFKRPEPPPESQNLLEIAGNVGPLIEKTATEIFLTYQYELFRKPFTYIIPAVWGVKKNGELSHVQKEISAKIAPIIDDAIEAFGFEKLTAAQEFALGYMVRGLIISKINLMMEMVKNQKTQPQKASTGTEDRLKHMEPIGNA